MESVFLKLFNMSVTAVWVVLAVLLLRFILKKAPKWLICSLWILVGLRLIFPFSIESSMSLIPSAETISPDIMYSDTPEIHSGIPEINSAVNPVIAESSAPAIGDSVNPIQIFIFIASIVWTAGMAVMLVCALISYLKLRKTVAAAVKLKENILICDDIKSPFILGIVRPRIYLPSEIGREEAEYVMAHEKGHIKRLDHVWKPLAFLLLVLHWFNPLMWLAYILLCRDIELACDERVISSMALNEKKAYSETLLSFSVPSRIVSACPLAFGEVGVKTRIKSVLNHKKPAFWIIVVALIASIVAALCFLTNPNSLSDKLGVSMDMAVAGANRSQQTDGDFIATDYDVLRIVKRKGKTTVYAWVMYQEYSYDGTEIKLEQGSHIPTAVTFDTSNNGDKSVYDVLEYWEPRDGGYYAEDIRAKFPRALWRRALDPSGAARQKENCMRMAREYYGVGEDKTVNAPFGKYYSVSDIIYESGMYSFSYTKETAPRYCLTDKKELLISEDRNTGNWLNAGTFEEVKLTNDNFDRYFRDVRGSAASLRRNNKSAWRLIVSDLPDSVFYYLLEQQNGDVYLTYGYWDASEKDDPDSNDTSIRWVFALAEDESVLKYFLTIGADDVYSVEVITPSGGDTYAGGASYKKGEKVYLELLDGYTDLRGVSVTALSKDGTVIFAIGIPEGEGHDNITIQSGNGWLLAPEGVSLKKLTREDVMELSEKGDKLTWNDFAQYEHIDTGSGLYIWKFDIDEMFTLIIGGAGLSTDPMYIYLLANDGLEETIDIRTEDAAKYIEEHKDNKLVKKLVYFGFSAEVGYGGNEIWNRFTHYPEMMLSSVRYLPYIRFENKEDFDAFYSEMEKLLDFDRSSEDFMPFSEIAEHYDDAFFNEWDLFVVYVETGRLQESFTADSVTKSEGVLSLNICENDPGPGDTLMNGWFVSIGIQKDDLSDVEKTVAPVTKYVEDK